MINQECAQIDVGLARDVVDAVKDAVFWRGPTDGGNYDNPIWRDQALELVSSAVAAVYRREVMETEDRSVCPAIGPRAKCPTSQNPSICRHLRT